MVAQFSGQCILTLEYSQYSDVPTLVFTEPTILKPHYIPAQTVRISGYDISMLIEKLNKVQAIIDKNRGA